MEEFGFEKIDEDDIFNPKQSPENMRSLHEIERIQNQSEEASLSDVEINTHTTSIDSTNEPTEEVSSLITPKNLSDVVAPEGQINPTPNPIEYGGGRVNPTPNPVEYQEGKLNPLPESIEYSGGRVNPTPNPVEYGEGRVNPTPNPVEYGEGRVNPTPNPVEYNEGKLNPLPEPIKYNNPKVNSSIQSSVLPDMNTDKSLTVETSKNLQVNQNLTFDLKNQNYTPVAPQRQSTYERNIQTTPASNDNFTFEIPTALSSSNSNTRRANRKKAPPSWRAQHG